MSHPAATAVTSVRLYAVTLFGLLALTALTTALAFVDLGVANEALALLVASAKATLVVLVFMHARESGRLTIVVIVVTLVWLAVLLVLTFTDYWTRRFLTFG